MRITLLLLLTVILLGSCAENTGPSETEYETEYVDDLIKLEIKTSTNEQGVDMNLIITNISNYRIYPATDSLPSLLITVYAHGEEVLQFSDDYFEDSYWNAGLKQNFAYAVTFFFSINELLQHSSLTGIDHGQIIVRLNMQEEYSNSRHPIELVTQYRFDRY